MNAGRELDALIAEKVFGYTLDEELRDHHDEYSTDMSDAWAAAEYMCNRYDCMIEVKRMASNYLTTKRYAALVRGGDLAYKRPDLTAYGRSSESPAHALCLAMLAALGIED